MGLPLVVETGDSVRDGVGESVGIGEGTISEIPLAIDTQLDIEVLSS